MEYKCLPFISRSHCCFHSNNFLLALRDSCLFSSLLFSPVCLASLSTLPLPIMPSVNPNEYEFIYRYFYWVNDWESQFSLWFCFTLLTGTVPKMNNAIFTQVCWLAQTLVAQLRKQDADFHRETILCIHRTKLSNTHTYLHKYRELNFFYCDFFQNVMREIHNLSCVCVCVYEKFHWKISWTY